MSYKRPFIWLCNYCMKEVRLNRYGLPYGWIYLPNTLQFPRATHACEICATSAARERKIKHV